MFEIYSVQTKKEQEEICGLCGVGFKIDCLAYAARENDKLLGVVQFRILGEYAVIYDLAGTGKPAAPEVLTVLGKSALNFVDLCGVKNAVIEPEHDNLPQLLGFVQDKDGVWRVNLEGYFSGCCKNTI